MMMTVSLPTEKTNETVRNGKLATAIQQMLMQLKPEAAYFTIDEKGRRCGIVVFDMSASSHMP
jgi:hypothetical protein